MELKLKNVLLAALFFILFALGFMIIFKSYDWGYSLSKQVFQQSEGVSSFTVDDKKVLIESIGFIVMGGILSLVSGFGIISALFKK